MRGRPQRSRSAVVQSTQNRAATFSARDFQCLRPPRQREQLPLSVPPIVGTLSHRGSLLRRFGLREGPPSRLFRARARTNPRETGVLPVNNPARPRLGAPQTSSAALRPGMQVEEVCARPQCWQAACSWVVGCVPGSRAQRGYPGSCCHHKDRGAHHSKPSSRSTSAKKSRHVGLCFSMASIFQSRRHRFMARSRRAARLASSWRSK